MAQDFAMELARLGPWTNGRPWPLARAQAYCRRLAQAHYENFAVATLFLPRRLRQHFCNVYAYCRWADDLGDETAGGAEALKLLAWWRAELLQCYDGKPKHPIFIALQQTIRRFAIPPQPFLDLIAAFEQDQRIRHYETYSQLLDYCRYSANPVGRLVLYLCECFDERRAALADRICTGLQLANFWQDVARDFAIGRVYLPAEDRRRFGYSDADLAARRFTPAFAELLRFEVGRARQLFEEGLALVPLVPSAVQVDVELFARGGLAILAKIEAQGYDVWRQRPILTRWEKARLMGSTLGRVLLRRIRRALSRPAFQQAVQGMPSTNSSICTGTRNVSWQRLQPSATSESPVRARS
ncbi:MAG: squalene synthase HpnC [Gemmataceae bacterium]|nr:squalene synthase HpnC [Gemmataceae bacterium]